MTKEQRVEIKNLLSSYKTMNGQIKCIDYEIELLKGHIEFLKGLRYTDSSIIESNNEIEHKRDIKSRLEGYINSIDNTLNELNNTERKIVELRYLEGKKHTWKEISNIVEYSSDYCRKEMLDKILFKTFNQL